MRQIVADVTAEGGITVVDEMKAAPRLGAELDETGVLGEEAIEAQWIEALEMLGSHLADAMAASLIQPAGRDWREASVLVGGALFLVLAHFGFSFGAFFDVITFSIAAGTSTMRTMVASTNTARQRSPS